MKNKSIGFEELGIFYANTVGLKATENSKVE